MKRKFKIILDIIMLILLITLFNKQFISMKYHEIAGLALIIIVVLHIVINIKTVTAMAKNFIKIPIVTKVGLVVDILLLLCFIAIGVSGILISHTILTDISSTNSIFKILHMFTGGLSVILIGIHIGLHICRRPMPAMAALILTALVLCGGAKGIAKSKEINFLTMPFNITSQMPKEHTQNNNPNNMEQNQPEPNKKGKNRQPLTTSERVNNVIMYLGMILSCSMITYWVVVPKKKQN